ncbi:MAG: hypothetical protein AMS25_08545 [Gemmatimonas sp. SM23_52]|nr:MAG: hypothetical protein AMS25_08545 [Gemmatimonas sp. SM23_52]
MMEDRFDDLLREAAQEYHRPPETPRELMWARIEAVRQERARRRQQLRVLYSPWTRWGLGLAAALAIGIGIGRLTIGARPGAEPVVVVPEVAGPVEPAARGQLAFRLAATAHLTRAETFLTSFRANLRAGESDAEFWSGAGELLSSTRLLLDSPAADDPVFRVLLEELELVLVQLSYERGGDELELVTEGLERGGLLPRLRTAIPAGPAVGMEGVL